MKVLLHQTHQTIADFDAIKQYLEQTLQDYPNDTLHLFPELFLCGYPLRDLCLQKSFITQYQDFLQAIHQISKKFKGSSKCLMGGLHYSLSKSGIPQSISNVIYEISGGHELQSIYQKQLLPNYDIFDEQKYFNPGTEDGIYSWGNYQIGLLICEDMWSSSVHKIDPALQLKHYTESKKLTLDFIINLSASPYFVGKLEKRIERTQYISSLFKCPLAYVNKVGGEDEILFDGASFITDGQDVIAQAKVFQADCLTWDLTAKRKYNYNPVDAASEKENTWESLFNPSFKKNKQELTTWSDEYCEEVVQALGFGFQEYVKKNKFKNFTIALSGGLDSAVVLTLMRIHLETEQYLEALYMPSIHSSPTSWDLSAKLCHNLGINLKSMPIKFLHSTAKNLFTQSFNQPFEGLTDENIQSRLRGLLLYTRSNQINSMVVNTSNKSELAVGYSTQYGDSVGAISLLGDVYKTQVYRLAHFINQKYDNLIPTEIITRPPTAELRPNQKDEDSLPPYERLDAILDGLINYRHNRTELINKGFTEQEVDHVTRLYLNSEYKRSQFCPILKIAPKSFGQGHRVPISKSNMFYFK
jgi:NAD+ synthase (glutamine-hydrolysing)